MADRKLRSWTLPAPWPRLAGWLRTFAAWLRPPRRLRFTRGGAVFTAGTLAVGLAAINTGNNLLYLLLGAMLGFVAVSGWLSEQVLRNLEVERRVPRGVTVGHAVQVAYQVENRRRRAPTLGLEIVEKGLPGTAFLPSLPPGESAVVRSRNHFVRRGVYPLEVMTLSTSFPFGLFRKERDLRRPAELVIWPRTDRPVREVSGAGGRARQRGPVGVGSAGARGEYRGLKEYRPGDDPRDIHWRSTARLGDPVVREYERDDARTLWICLDTRGRPGERAEAAVEAAAALAARAARRGRRFALAASGRRVGPGSGPGQLERVLDALARVDFGPDQPPVSPPTDPARCVLVTSQLRTAGGFGDVVAVDEGGSA